MLVVSPKRLVPVQINTIILQGEDGQFYYLHRDLYDQLVVLADSYDYGARLDLLMKALYGDGVTLPENVQRFFDTVPSPINMAAPFLLLVKGVEQLESIEDMCGALTVISMSANLRRIPKVDKSIRAAVTFSLHIKEEYRSHWDRFFQENPEFGAAVSLPASAPTHTHIPTPEGTTIIVDQQTGEEQEVQFTKPIENFDFDAMMADILKDEEAEKEALGKDEEPAPTDGGSKVQSGLDLFSGI